MGYLDNNGLAHLWEALKTNLSGKQDKLTGSPGQIVGFDDGGNAVPLSPDSPGGGGDAGEIFSTQETQIGTWTNGKPLYRKVLTAAITVASGKKINQIIAPVGEAAQIVSVRGNLSVVQSGAVKAYSDLPVATPTGTTVFDNTCCMFTVSAGNLLLLGYTSSSTLAGTWNVNIILEYTKTADEE